MKGGDDTDTDSDSEPDSVYSVHSSDFEEARREFNLSYYRNKYPGHYAAKSGDIEGVKKYIKRGIKTYIRTDRAVDRESRVNCQDEFYGETMLYIAIKNKNPKLVYFLLNGAKADYYEQQIHGSSILEWIKEKPEMFTNEINDIIMDRALKDKKITYEEYNLSKREKRREGPVPGRRFGEPEPDDYSSD